MEYLISKKKTDVHSRRLKFYCDNDLESAIPLELVVQREDACELAMEEILQCKYVSSIRDHAFKIKWVGFGEEEATWEDPVHIHAMEPDVVEEYVSSMRNTASKRAIIEMLDLDLNYWGNFIYEIIGIKEPVNTGT